MNHIPAILNAIWAPLALLSLIGMLVLGITSWHETREQMRRESARPNRPDVL